MSIDCIYYIKMGNTNTNVNNIEYSLDTASTPRIERIGALYLLFSNLSFQFKRKRKKKRKKEREYNPSVCLCVWGGGAYLGPVGCRCALLLVARFPLVPGELHRCDTPRV